MKTTLLAFGLAIGLGHSATAATFNTLTAIEARWSQNGGPIDPLSKTDSDSGVKGVAGVNLTSGDCYDPACTIMSGFQAGDGRSYLGLDVQWADSLDQVSRARIEARRKVAILNEGPGSFQLSFDYELKNMSIDLFAGSGGPQEDSNPFDGPSEAVGVRIGYSVFLNDIEERRHSFTLWGGANDNGNGTWFDWDSEGGLSPTMLTPTDCLFGQCDGRNASFDSFTRSLDLGRFGVGEEKTVETRMWVEAIGNLRQEWDAQARIGDPSGIPATSFTVIADPVSPVPLPASAFLLLAGFGALFGLRRAR